LPTQRFDKYFVAVLPQAGHQWRLQLSRCSRYEMHVEHPFFN